MTDLSTPECSTHGMLASHQLVVHGVRHNGILRTALLHVPRNNRPRRGYPLLMVFHGGASSPENIAQISGMNRIAEREGFIVCYPAGLRTKAGLSWSVGGKEDARRTGDARFVGILMMDLQRRYEIDQARIFAAGFSIGGSLVYELASQFADRITAAAVVSGAMTAGVFEPIRPVPLIHVHGTRDRRVPLKGGRGPATAAANDWLSVQAGIDRWREMNGCIGDARVVRHGLQGVTEHHYAGIADVELWLVEGGYHSWPGSETSRDEDLPVSGFSASENIWRFFASRRSSTVRYSRYVML